MIKVAISGVPGAGKTSTVRSLAGYVRRSSLNYKNVELCSEYARRYISKYGLINNIWEQYRILNKQVEWEDSYKYADLVITDSPIQLGFSYTVGLVDHNDPKSILSITDYIKALYKANIGYRYDFIFHFGPVLKPVDDGVREKIQFTDDWRKEKNDVILHSLRMFPPKNFVLVPDEISSMEDRINFIFSHIERN